MYGSRVDRGICGLLMDEVHEVSRRDQASWPDLSAREHQYETSRIFVSYMPSSITITI